ncbi:MAG: zinc ABC transporter substrate-binding protein [Alphaproteobacteria bacterium]
MSSFFTRRVRPLLAVLALAAGAVPQAASALEVVATVKPIHALVAAVMGETGTPSLLIAGKASPHTWQLRPSDARRLEAADLVVWVGPSLETPLARPIATLVRPSALLTLVATPGVRTLPARSGGVWEDDGHDHRHGAAAAEAIDGHLWLDPLNAAGVARAVAAALAARDPAGADGYRARADAVTERLMALDAELRARLTPAAAYPYLSFHDAYQYLEARYGLNAVGAIAVSPERKPGARRLQALRQRVRSAGVACVFAEPQFDPGLVTTVTEGTRARAGILDPLGVSIPEGPELYPTLMRGLAQALTDCLLGAR